MFKYTLLTVVIINVMETPCCGDMRRRGGLNGGIDQSSSESSNKLFFFNTFGIVFSLSGIFLVKIVYQPFIIGDVFWTIDKFLTASDKLSITERYCLFNSSSYLTLCLRASHYSVLLIVVFSILTVQEDQFEKIVFCYYFLV